MKVIKSLLTMTAFVCLILVMSLSVCAEGEIFIDLQKVVTDTPSQIINDRTMVPVRAITEMLGYDVRWDADDQQVEVYENNSNAPAIVMQIDNPKAYYTKYDEVTGEYAEVEVVLDSPATLVNSRTFVPLRFISEAVGYLVEYDEESGIVFLFSPEYIQNHRGEGKGEEISGVSEDGIGSVIPLSMEEMEYVVSQKTEDWLAMSEEEKSEYVVLVGRWWEAYENRIVEDYDDMVKVVQHQMEQYHRNKVNDFVFLTICEIYQVDKSKYVIEQFE